MLPESAGRRTDQLWGPDVATPLAPLCRALSLSRRSRSHPRPTIGRAVSRTHKVGAQTDSQMACARLLQPHQRPRCSSNPSRHPSTRARSTPDQTHRRLTHTHLIKSRPYAAKHTRIATRAADPRSSSTGEFCRCCCPPQETRALNEADC